MKTTKKPEANKGGRPSFEPTKQQKSMVKTMCGFGIPVEDICKVIENPQTGKPINKTTAYKHFKDEIESGHVLANFKVAKNLFTIATGSTPQAVTAAIFYLKCRARWSDKAGSDSEPEEVQAPSEIRIIGVPGRGKEK